ncbi:hypothetical protein Y032_0008g380 [Ancylostoma ceylanicum]|uniref:LIM zinc-binding domain-containing protein n=1 Tax=Ancylostoma ceylanicum TaxID=53326 RepID=A0A016VLL3_9BILA|nr:hypothetical protein Y032_0008g380 [Ancylostoma ceylanicum]
MKKPIQSDAAYVLGRVWHVRHLACKMCKATLTVTGCRASPLDASTPICIDCYMETQHPSCYTCHLPLRETCVTAMRKKYHHECFRCCRCRGAMPSLSLFYGSRGLTFAKPFQMVNTTSGMGMRSMRIATML